MQGLHVPRLVATVLGAFLVPIAGALQTGGNLKHAAMAGFGMALAAFIGFIQQPGKGGAQNG